jgi:hypothetical protein
MGGVSSTITQATRARLLMNYSFTIRYMYVYVRHPVCCRLLKYSAHKIKKGRRWRKRNDFVMSDDNFSSCHFNSIKLLNVLVVIVKWSDNRFSFFFFFASKHSGWVREKSQWTVYPTVMNYVQIVHYHRKEQECCSEWNKDEYVFLPYHFLFIRLHHTWLFWTVSYQFFFSCIT